MTRQFLEELYEVGDPKVDLLGEPFGKLDYYVFDPMKIIKLVIFFLLFARLFKPQPPSPKPLPCFMFQDTSPDYVYGKITRVTSNIGSLGEYCQMMMKQMLVDDFIGGLYREFLAMRQCQVEE
ncbi:unnamed protein product [Dovyalis caffra]|uniref:Uncharacterized protein n=1 Tax=Dovyalis caffra TaxID=77055 RepID=A0AAV1SFC7_9ROSI|nr:unnamed protein product [Dovyalis caffra]